MKKLLDKVETWNESRYLFIAINIIVYCFMLFLNFNTDLYIDDFRCLHMWSDVNHPITNLSEAITSNNEYYMDAGGRWISYFLVQFLLIYNKHLFDFINAAFCVALGIVLYKYAQKNNEVDNALLIMIHVLLWYFTPTWGQEFLWVSGSVMYLWTLVIVLCFGLQYYRKVRFGKDEGINGYNKSNVLGYVMCVVLGFWSGLSLEPIACVLFCALVAFVIYQLRNDKEIAADDILGIISFLSGFAVLMLCPGNYKRASVIQESANIFIKYAFRFFRVNYYFVVYLAPMVGIIVAFGLLCKSNIKKVTKEIIILGVAAFLSVYVMLFSAGFASRVFLAPTALIVTVAGLLYSRMTIDIKKYMLVAFAIVSVGILVQGSVLSYAASVTGDLMRDSSVYIDAATNF